MRRKILKNKLFLYFTEFFAGMSVMAVELGASRLLAPYFSSSQIVWTIIIGTIMIAMALGNIYGGRKADKDPNPDKLYRRIIIASVWIALIPVVGKYVIVGISGLLIFTINTNFLIIAALISCLVIFVFPLFLLGTVTPSLARYTVENVNDSGKVVGNLNAFNTVGSIIGTFVPTFISIPAVGTSITFLIFAGILLALAIIYFISPKEKSGDDFQPEAQPDPQPSHQPEEEEPAEPERTDAGSTEPKPDVQPSKKKELKTPVAGIIIACLVFILSCIFGHNNSFAFWESSLTYEGESIYNYLQVSEDDEERILSTNVLFGVQSVMLKKPGLTGMYYDYAMASPFMAGVHEKESLDVLILGMGTGTFATQCTRYLDGLKIEGVEIDEKITDLAREYFELSDDIKVTTYDGRAYLNAVDKKYDLIMVDAYQDITIPFQMSSIEFFTLVKDHLTEDGVMVVNMNMRGSEEGNINQYLADTISAVFSEVYTVDVPYATNRELFASDNPDLIKRFKTNAELEKNAELKKLMQKIEKNIEAYDAGTYLLTDDKAPVELLGMKVIDELIVDEVSYYKNLYEEKGLNGLIDELLGE